MGESAEAVVARLLPPGAGLQDPARLRPLLLEALRSTPVFSASDRAWVIRVGARFFRGFDSRRRMMTARHLAVALLFPADAKDGVTGMVAALVKLGKAASLVEVTCR